MGNALRSLQELLLDRQHARILRLTFPFFQTYAKLTIVNFSVGFLLQRGRFHPAFVRRPVPSPPQAEAVELTAMFLRFIAAFTSRSWDAPQPGQVQ
jgi:hypothetical protein